MRKSAPQKTGTGKRMPLVSIAIALAVLCTLALSAVPATEANASTPAATQRNSIYMFGRINVYATIPQPGRSKKYERRTYLTPLVEVSRADFNKYQLSSIVELGHAWKNLTEYFNNTVDKAAAGRGEDLSASGSDIRVWSNVEMGNNAYDGYIFTPKANLEQKRDEEIKNAQVGERKIIIFNWDPTGKNVDKDLERETKGAATP